VEPKAISSSFPVEKRGIGDIIHFYFGDSRVSVIWRDVLFDSNGEAVPFITYYPRGFDSCVVMDLLGILLGKYHVSSAKILEVSQSPLLSIGNLL